MANDIKSGIGYIIPAAAVVGCFTTLLLGVFTSTQFVESYNTFWNITFTWHIHGFWCGPEYVGRYRVPNRRSPICTGNLIFLYFDRDAVQESNIFRPACYFSWRLNEPWKTMGSKGFKTKLEQAERLDSKGNHPPTKNILEILIQMQFSD